MARWNLGCWIALLFVGGALVVSAADAPAVRQLDQATYSAEALGALPAALAQLQFILSDESLGSQRQLGQDGWAARDFALFTAGSLADRGYPVYIATEGARVWVVVGLAVTPNEVVWLPVVSTPNPGDGQKTLGDVPFESPGGGGVLDERYLAFGSVSVLPQNFPPTAQFRFSATTVDYGSSVMVLAAGSFDPDGRIVLYRWCIGDGTCAVTLTWSYSVTSNTVSDVLSVTLVVVDDQGRSASASGTIQVTNLQMNKDPLPILPCGCSG